MNFIEQAYKGKNSLWIWLLTILTVGSQYLLNLYSYLTRDNTAKLVPFQGDKNKAIAQGSLLYIVLLLLLFLFVKFLHKRSIKTLITSSKNIDWWRILFGFSSWGVFAIIFLSLNYAQDGRVYLWNFKPKPFFTLLLISLTLLPLRATFIEIFFRGYLLQGISRIVKIPFIALLLVSLIFMAVCVNSIVQILGISILFFYFSSSILSGVITIMDDKLELAIGMHAMNDVLAALYITTNWALFQTDAMLLDTSPPNLLFLVYIPVFVFFPLYIFMLSKLYQWNNWKEKLFDRVEKPEVI